MAFAKKITMSSQNKAVSPPAKKEKEPQDSGRGKSGKGGKVHKGKY